MFKFNLINILGPQIYYSVDNHLIYHILLENDNPLVNDEFVSLLEEHIKFFLSQNNNIKSQLYYNLNSKSNNTKVLVLLKDNTEIELKWSDKKNDFLSSTSFKTIVHKTNLMILPSSIDFDCDSESVYSLDLEITKNKKFKKL
tara:strand:+ start:61 stop:489 length:429 start_codon:yes stop_codon:yes gene_type:complete